MPLQSLNTRRSLDSQMVTVDFTPYISLAELSSSASSIASTASVVTGNDPNPSNIIGASSLISTQGQIIGNQLLVNGVSGTIYEIVCKVTMSSGNVYTINLYQAVNDNAI